MSEIEILNEFKTQLLSFFDELIAQFPKEGDLIICRLFFDNQIPIKSVMDNFIYNINKNDKELLKMIQQRNESFFLEHNIFTTVEKEKVNHFKKIWCSGHLDDEDKTIIWNWIDAFVYLAEKYTKAINNE